MLVTDLDGWTQVVTANPVPEGWSRDPDMWPEDMTHDERGDAYGAVVVIVAERWADEMERRLAEDHNATVADIASESFSAVNGDRWGLTGFQYGAAVSILAQVWDRGDELRRWHNLDTQIGTEGEAANAKGTVLNPALLNIAGDVEPDD